MQLIHLINDTDSVIICIDIKTAAHWEYNYKNKGNDINYDSDKPDKNFPHIYDLKNGNLHKYDGWTIRIDNPLDVDTAYTLSIEWYQRDTRISEWKNNGTVQAGQTVIPIPGGDAKYVTP